MRRVAQIISPRIDSSGPEDTDGSESVVIYDFNCECIRYELYYPALLPEALEKVGVFTAMNVELRIKPKMSRLKKLHVN